MSVLNWLELTQAIWKMRDDPTLRRVEVALQGRRPKRAQNRAYRVARDFDIRVRTFHIRISDSICIERLPDCST